MLRPLAVLTLFAAIGAASAEDIVILATREGATQSYLLSSPPVGKARAVAVLFAGHGIIAAVMDAPSDQPRGMDDGFRQSGVHAEDIGRVVANLKSRYPGLPVFLVGTSRGSISAAYAGQRLDRNVDGVVLTASVLLATRRQPGLSGFDFSSIPVPLLLVHHVDDGCEYSPHQAAKRLADRYPLISVSGGPPAQSKPCEAMSPHGFLGREADTVDAIAKWMLKQPHPREIN